MTVKGCQMKVMERCVKVKGMERCVRVKDGDGKVMMQRFEVK